MKTLILDNYDSFTYILAQYVDELKGKPIVKKNDEITLEEIKTLNPTHIILSPGPGRPENEKDFGIGAKVIKQFGPTTPLLGVCLGHQGIAHHFGAKIIHAPQVMHGKKSNITHDGEGAFYGLPSPFTAMRYHSLMIDPKTLPKTLKITATTPDNLIMGIRHKTWPIEGIQFHPESIGTEHGKKMIKNFLLANFPLHQDHSMISSPRSLTKKS